MAISSPPDAISKTRDLPGQTGRVDISVEILKHRRALRDRESNAIVDRLPERLPERVPAPDGSIDTYA